MKTLNPNMWLQKNGSAIYVTGHKVFTNTVIMIIEPSDGAQPDDTSKQKLAEFLKCGAELDYQKIEIEWPINELVQCSDCLGSGLGNDECPECLGEGEVTTETDYNEYENQCLSCYGRGKKRSSDTSLVCEGCGGKGKKPHAYQPIEICGMAVPLPQLQMLSGVEELMFAACVEKNALFWRSESEGCWGAISRLNV